MTASAGLLSLALKSIPVGTAYAVWTGIGVAGAGGARSLSFRRAGGPLAAVVHRPHSGGRRRIKTGVLVVLPEARSAEDVGVGNAQRAAVRRNRGLSGVCRRQRRVLSKRLEFGEECLSSRPRPIPIMRELTRRDRAGPPSSPARRRRRAAIVPPGDPNKARRRSGPGREDRALPRRHDRSRRRV